MKHIIMTYGVAILPLAIYLGVLAWGKFQLHEIPSWFGQAGAVVTVKSANETNMDATPPRLVPAYTHNGRVREYTGVCAFNNGDNATSQYRIHRVRSNDRVSRMRLDCDALGAGGAIKVGLYDTTLAGGAAVSDALFAASTVFAAAQADVNLLTAQPTPANREKRIWELLGLASDPQKEYDVVATVTVVTAAAGSIAITTNVVQN